MLRISEYIRATLAGHKARPFSGVILIWNLTNLCNLACKHCYASARPERQEQISSARALSLIPELKRAGVKFAILSGGEPLVRQDLFTIAQKLREEGIKTYLSTNGLLVNRNNIEQICAHFDYIGISIDGKEEVHDHFRGKKGAFRRSLDAIRLARDHGLKVGLRFTLTPFTCSSLPFVFEVVENEKLPKVYISHLVYAGRGGELHDIASHRYREIVSWIIERSFDYVEKGTAIDVVTGNNEADAVVLWQEFSKRYPALAEPFYQRLLTWGGNQAGKRLVNIDHKGNVKPDPFFPISLGNIQKRSFDELWNTHPTLLKLRQYPRPLAGKCRHCNFLAICNGNSRARGYALSGDYWQSDPACYLDSSLSTALS